MKSLKYARAIKFGFCKILLWLIIVHSCCFRLATQQRGVPRPVPPNRGNGQPNPSKIKVSKWLQPGQELVFSSSGATPTPNTAVPVFVNNVPVSATLAPFIPAATTPSPQFLQCFERCPTTSEYNPICASNRQLYGNEQKFNCARSCGAAIEIVRRGSCNGLIQMQRG